MARFMPEQWALPALSPFNRDFFTSGRIVVQECTACGTLQHPPEEVCYKCLGMSFRSRPTNGRGTIYSLMVVHHPVSPILRERVPYAVVLVSLDEHPELRVLGNVPNRAPGELAIGQRVRAVFEEIPDPDTGEKLLLPQWEVVDAP